MEACAGRHPHEADATWIMFMRAASGWSVKRDCSTEDPLGNCPDTAWGRGEGEQVEGRVYRVWPQQPGGRQRRAHTPPTSQP